MFQRISLQRCSRASLLRFTRNFLLLVFVFSVVSCSSVGKLDQRLDSRVGDMNLPMLNGGSVKFNELVGKNKVVLVNFWATWCGPCRREIPDLAALHNQFKDKGVEVVGLTIEDPAQATEMVKMFVQQFSMNYRVGFSSKEMFFLFNKANGDRPGAPIPQTFIFGKEGQIIDSFPGLRPDFRTWAENAINRALSS
jgi:thiol-disulfide isomerase/thioredoxin